MSPSSRDRRARSARGPAPSRPFRERAGIAAAALFGLGVLARLLFLAGTRDSQLPFSIFYYGDSRLYREFALALLDGRTFDNGIPYHPPLFAFVLAIVIRLVGENPFALRAVLAVIGALVVPLTYLLGRRLWGAAVGGVGAVLAAVSFGLCVAAVSPNTETIYIPILVGQALCVMALSEALHAQDLRRIVLLALTCGALAGMGSLTRAEHLAFLGLCPLALWLDRGRPRDAPAGEGKDTARPGAHAARGSERVRAGRLADARAFLEGTRLRPVLLACALIVGGGLCVIAPWTIHNAAAIRRFNASHPGPEPLPELVAVSSYGALNFALANSEGSDGAFRPDLIVGRTGGSRLDLDDARQREIYLHGYRQGIAFLATDPVRALRLVAAKLAIASDAFLLGVGPSNLPFGLSGTRRAVDIFAPDRTPLVLVPIALVAAGAWVSRRLWRRGSIVWLAILHKAAICAAFFGYVRVFVHIAPFLILIASAALVAASERWLAAPWHRRAALAGAALAGCLVLEMAWRAAHPREFVISGSSDPANGKLIQDAPMRLSPKSE